MIIARKVALRPSASQRIALAKAAGCARVAWNWGLHRKQESYRATGKSPSAIDLHRELNLLKKKPVEDGGYPWMYESSKSAPQEALRDLDGAFTNFFEKRSKYPRFKRKVPGSGHVRLGGSVRVTRTHLQLPRIGPVRIAPNDRGYVVGAFDACSVVQEHGRWFASVRVEVAEAPAVLQETPAEVGIDLGCRKLAVLATPNGAIEVIVGRKALLRAARKLRALQKTVSRRKKGSARRRRAVRAVGEAHHRVVNIRRDALHKATTDIATRYRVVAMERLAVKTMTRKGLGPGRRAKAGLNRVMADASFGEFRRLLDYKLQLRGGHLVLVNPAYTSQDCSCCGARNDPGSSEVYTCAACGVVLDRDANASRNILARATGGVVATSWQETINARGEVIRRRSLRAATLASRKRERGRGGQRV